MRFPTMCMCDQQRLRPACAYTQSDQSHCLSLEYSMTVKLLTEHHLEFLSLKGGGTGSSESIHVKMPHCWKSRAAAQYVKKGLKDVKGKQNFEHKIVPVRSGLDDFVCLSLRPIKIFQL